MVLYVFVAVLLILGTFDLKKSKLLYRIDSSVCIHSFSRYKLGWNRCLLLSKVL